MAVFKQAWSKRRPCDLSRLVFMIVLLMMAPITILALPNGFIAEIVSHANSVSGVFAPNPRNDNKPMLILVAKEGQVKVIEDPDEHDPAGQREDAMEILSIKDFICGNTERGLQSIVVSPNFEENQYVYLYYTKFQEGCLQAEDEDQDGPRPWNVLERFEMNKETLLLDFESREQIWRGAELHDDIHNGGAMLFGKDGYLYVTTGDSGDNTNGQERTNVHGSLVRLNEDGSIPRDNPYFDHDTLDSYHCGTDEREGKVPSNLRDAVCQETWGIGLRNPFRLSMNPNTDDDTTLLAISDVGAGTWEEISYGGTNYKGANYGYKVYEGPCHRFSTTECPEMEPGFQMPFHYYEHREDKSGCVSGSVFVPNDIGWPKKFEFLFADFVWRRVYYLTLDDETGCRECTPPRSQYTNTTFYQTQDGDSSSKNNGKIVDLFFGPYQDTQALYVITFGNDNTVTRIRYTGSVDNDPPKARLEVENEVVDDESGTVQPFELEEEVFFDGSGSSDPDGDPLTFRWDFGDDSDGSDEERPVHTYRTPGEYFVTLFVTDSAGHIQQDTTTVVVGTRPVAIILTPTVGEKFSVGEVLRVHGEAYYTDGTPFADSDLVWEVRKHHDDHWHPFLDPTNGNNFDLDPGPKPEDFYASTNSYLEVILAVEDEYGVTGVAREIVWPKLVDVELRTGPPGLFLSIDEEPMETSITITSWENHKVELLATDQFPYAFSKWSDGVETRTRVDQLKKRGLSFTAIFCLENWADCVTDGTCCTGFCFEGACVRDSAVEANDGA